MSQKSVQRRGEIGYSSVTRSYSLQQQDRTHERRDQRPGTGNEGPRKERHIDTDRLPTVPQLYSPTHGFRRESSGRSGGNTGQRQEQVAYDN